LAVKNKSPVRLRYGANKYAAFSLLISRWVRSGAATAESYVYVTLAGTELGDVKSLHFIDPGLVTKTFAFEYDRENYRVATQNGRVLKSSGIDVTVSNTNLLDYGRPDPRPHIFHVDLPGIFAWADYSTRVGRMFQREIIKEGDCILITSHLGHRPVIEEVQKNFSGELAVLGVSSKEDVAKLFRRAHPSFTLFKALTTYRLARELNLKCFGCVRYRDTTPMGIYGYVVDAGTTELRDLVDDPAIGYFNMNTLAACSANEF
jgi:hypothetical protein